MFSCAPSEEVDPRIDLLKQVAATGSPARSLSTASTPNLPVNFERPPELSNNRSNDGEPELSGGEPAITEVPPPGVAPPSPPPPPPPSPSQRKRRNTLSVDVSTVYESDEEINTPSDSLVSSPSGVFLSARSSHRAPIAWAGSRLERSACMHCGTSSARRRSTTVGPAGTSTAEGAPSPSARDPPRRRQAPRLHLLQPGRWRHGRGRWCGAAAVTAAADGGQTGAFG